MNRGLTYLLSRTAIGKLRQLRRRLRDRKGRFVVIFAAVLLLAVVVPQMWAPATADQAQRVARYADLFRLWGPPLLLVSALASALSGRGIYFKPAEIDFLFAAPVSRRQLLLYGVFSRFGLAALSALWTSAFVAPQVSHWHAAALGLFFGLAFLQLTAQASALVLATVGVRLTRPIRQAVMIGFLVLVVGALLLGGALIPRAGQLIDGLRAAVESRPSRVVTAVARPMVEVLVAQDMTALLGWSILATLVLGAIVVVMMLLDVAYLEASLATSARLQEKLRRVRASGGSLALFGSAKRATPGRVLPMLPRVGGAGPIAWRQAVAMARTVRSVVAALVITIPATIVPVLILATSANPRREFGIAFAGALIPTFLMTQHLAFDFRRDLDRMALLKSLPLSPLALAAGQLVSPTAMFTLLQLALLAGLASVSDDVPLILVLVIAVLLPVANWIVAAVDNALFLLMPYRVAQDDAASMPFTGHVMVAMVLKTLALGLVGGASVMTGITVSKACGGSVLAAGLGGGAVLVLAAVALTALVGRAFSAFDVSTHVPA